MNKVKLFALGGFFIVLFALILTTVFMGFRIRTQKNKIAELEAKMHKTTAEKAALLQTLEAQKKIDEKYSEVVISQVGGVLEKSFIEDFNRLFYLFDSCLSDNEN